jgi:uncharacterized membrane protein YfcA
MPSSGKRKQIEECSKREVVAFLIAGSAISALIGATVVLQFERNKVMGTVGGLFTVVWLFGLWSRCLKRLRALKEKS